MSESTDFVLLVYTTSKGCIDPSLCLLPSLYNPRRTLLTTSTIVSNNARDTRFIIIDSEDKEDCFDDVERVLLIKAAHRQRWLRSASRTRLYFTWPNVECPLRTEKCSSWMRRSFCRTSFDFPVADELPSLAKACIAAASPKSVLAPMDDSQSCLSWNLKKHNNKFGTPMPARRSSKDEIATSGNPLEPRIAPRTSSDSVIDILAPPAPIGC